MKASNFNLKSIKIWKVGSESGEPVYIYKSGASQGGVVLGFQYFEDLIDVGYKATLTINDTGFNLISTLPVQGFEKVTIEVTDYLGKAHEYAFRLWKVGNRIEADRRRIYTLGLVSEAFILNEGSVVNKVLEGTPTKIVEKLLKEYLSVPGSKIKTQPSLNVMKMIPANKKPFGIIRDLQAKAVSESSVEPKVKTSKPSPATAATTSQRSDAPTTASVKSGSAGYFFYETRDGFVFRSIDSVVSPDPKKFNGSEPVAEYVYKPAKIEQTEAEDDRKIKNIAFQSEIDIMKKMRAGAYSSLICFFNINTGKYEEYTYKLSDVWDKMAHLGTQTVLPSGQKSLSQYPTRILSTVVNHENWYNGTGVANPEEGSDNTNAVSDSQKQYLAQSIARGGILSNYQLSIEVTGNLDLRVGEKIIVKMPNQVPNQSKGELGSFDPEHSGVYLIKSINHQFMMQNLECLTVLQLVRDSLGYKESNVS
jgi:hypothetical protein